VEDDIMPDTYFRVFSRMLGLAKPLEECVHNPISFPNALNVTNIIYGTFTYCNESFTVSNGITTYLPNEVYTILTNHNCTEKINSTLTAMYNFACKVAGFTCNVESSDVAAIYPKSNATSNYNAISSYSDSCDPIILPEPILSCFNSVVQKACDTADELQAELDELTKRRMYLIISSAVIVSGLAFGLYGLYKRHKKQSEQREISIQDKLLNDDSRSDSEDLHTERDSIESSRARSVILV
jgi:hypothetical protein